MQQFAAADKTPAKKISDQYIVVLKKQSGLAASSEQSRDNQVDKVDKWAEKMKAKGKDVIRKYRDALQGFAVKVNDDKSLQELRNDPEVQSVEADALVGIYGQSTPKGINRVDGDLSSTLSGNGWGAVDADIAILDTGIDLYHQDLKVYKNKSFVSGVANGDDDNGHGTHVAGIAAAKDNVQGVVGMAPGARLWAIKVLDQDGLGYVSDVIAGIDYVANNAGEIEVANLSFGFQGVSQALDTAIANSVAKGVTFVAAAGNDGRDASSYSPANNPNVITVSAIVDTDGRCGGWAGSSQYGKDDSLASFSNYGSVVDIAAPGVGVKSTYDGRTYATMSGTSMAAPHVTGAAALYMSNNPDATPSQVMSALTTMGSIPSTVCDGKGHGYFSGDTDGYNEPLLYSKRY